MFPFVYSHAVVIEKHHQANDLFPSSAEQGQSVCWCRQSWLDRSENFSRHPERDDITGNRPTSPLTRHSRKGPSTRVGFPKNVQSSNQN